MIIIFQRFGRTIGALGGRLQQYDFEVIYRKGVSHKNADELSRKDPQVISEIKDFSGVVAFTWNKKRQDNYSTSTVK